MARISVAERELVEMGIIDPVASNRSGIKFRRMMIGRMNKYCVRVIMGIIRNAENDSVGGVGGAGSAAAGGAGLDTSMLADAMYRVLVVVKDDFARQEAILRRTSGVPRGLSQGRIFRYTRSVEDERVLVENAWLDLGRYKEKNMGSVGDVMGMDGEFGAGISGMCSWWLQRFAGID